MRFVVPCLALALAACASSSPKVSDFNGDSVKVKVSCGMAYDCAKPRPEDEAEAQKTCALRGRKAQFASSINKPDYINGIMVDGYEHLYLCV